MRTVPVGRTDNATTTFTAQNAQRSTQSQLPLPRGGGQTDRRADVSANDDQPAQRCAADRERGRGGGAAAKTVHSFPPSCFPFSCVESTVPSRVPTLAALMRVENESRSRCISCSGGAETPVGRLRLWPTRLLHLNRCRVCTESLLNENDLLINITGNKDPITSAAHSDRSLQLCLRQIRSFLRYCSANLPWER